MALPRPRQLGSFELLARLAKGGMAEIYLARPVGATDLSGLVVVKRVLPHLAEERRFVSMFLEEARLAASLKHPNVVRVVEVGVEAGEYFMALEYLPGPSVASISRRARRAQTPIPLPIAGEIVCQIADGLHAAHELRDAKGRLLQVVHRDVSPHNLMLGEGGVMKLLDFGIAKVRDSAVHTSTGHIKGKFPYMSPEQGLGEPLDRRSDLFSLGTVLYELLVARRLFQRPSDLLTLKAITEEKVPSPRSILPELPEGVERVVLRSLERHREDRFATAAEFAAALREALSGLGLESSPEGVDAWVQASCRDLVTPRATALRQLAERPPSEEVPVLEDFVTRLSTAPDLVTRASRRRRRQLGRRFGPRFWFAVAVVMLGCAGGIFAHLFLRRSRLEGPPLRFAIAPSYPPAVLRTEMAPLVGYLERAIGRPIELVVPATYGATTELLLRGEAHFGDIPPLQFVRARAGRAQLQPLAAYSYEGARTYQGYLVVRDDSPLLEAKGLKGRRLCYVERGSASGYLLPRQFLRQAGLDPDRDLPAPRFSGTHPAVLEDVLAGRCDAGAVYSGATLSASVMGMPSSRLRVLAVTGQLPYDLICAAPQLAPELTRALARALLALEPRRDLGRATIGNIYRVSRFLTVRLEDFAAVEAAARADGLLKR